MLLTCASGRSPDGTCFRAAENVQDPTAKCVGSVCHEYPPVVLISVDGLAVSSGILVPYDDDSYSRRRLVRSPLAPQFKQAPQPAHASHASAVSASRYSVREWILPADLTNVVLGDSYVPGQQRERRPDCDDSETESACYLLADTDLQSPQQLVKPVQLKGVLFHHQRHGAIQLHFSALGAMEATLGPQQYQRMIKVLTGRCDNEYVLGTLRCIPGIKLRIVTDDIDASP